MVSDKNSDILTLRLTAKQVRSAQILDASNYMLAALTSVSVLSMSKLSRCTDSWKLQSSRTTGPDPDELSSVAKKQHKIIMQGQTPFINIVSITPHIALNHKKNPGKTSLHTMVRYDKNGQ